LIEQTLYNLAVQLGILGVFLVSFLGASSVLFPIPYTVIVFWLSIATDIDPLFLIFSAALGSALGEFVGYSIGYTTKKIVGEKTKKKFDAMLRVLMKHKNIWPLLVFLFAFTPLPDDLLFIPLGLIHFNFLKVFVPCLAGKILMFYMIVFGGKYASFYVHFILGSETTPLRSVLFTLVMTIILFIIIWVMWKIDWEKILTKDEFLSKHNFKNKT